MKQRDQRNVRDQTRGDDAPEATAPMATGALSPWPSVVAVGRWDGPPCGWPHSLATLPRQPTFHRPQPPCQVKWRDLLTDLSLAPTSLDPERSEGAGVGVLGVAVDLARRATAPPVPAGKDHAPQVHRGFLAAHDSVAARVAAVVDAVVDEEEGEEEGGERGDRGSSARPWRVSVTGHSLGGALATLSAVDLHRLSKGRYVVDLLTFGAPRVGDRNLVEAVEKACARGGCFRVASERDVVVTVPKLLGYAHAGVEIRLCADGSVREAGALLMDGRGGREVAASLSRELGLSPGPVLGPWEQEAAAVTQALGRAELEALVKEELLVLMHLADGTALAHHMEDVYLDALRACWEGTGSEAESD